MNCCVQEPMGWRAESPLPWTVKNSVSSFVSGAAASGMGSYAQSVDMSTGLMVASTTAMGGLVAWAIGGDFLREQCKGWKLGYSIILHIMGKMII